MTMISGRLVPAAVLFISGLAVSQPILLDDFEQIEGWRSVVSEGAKLTIGAGPGNPGKALKMEFDLTAGSGYAIAQKDFPLLLPANYQFTFDLRGDCPVNNFE